MPTSLERFSGLMSNLFRRKLYINAYENVVYEHLTFNARSNQELQKLYTSLVEVRIIEDFIADFISRIPAGVEDAAGNEVKRSPLNQLIQQANPQQSFQELLKEYLVYYGLTGNAYMFYNDNYLYNLPTDEVEIVTRFPVEVPEYRNWVEYFKHNYEGIDYLLPGDQVLHLKTAQLEAERGSWVYGSSPYSAAEPNIKALEANNSARVSTMNDRGALGFITNDSEYPDKDATEEAQENMQKYGLKEGQYKFLISTQKLRYQKMSMNLEELKLLENLEVDFNKLCMLRGIDPVIFFSGDTTYANQYQAYKATVKRALLPLAYHFYDKANLWIKRNTGTTNRLVPQVDKLPDYSELGVEHSARLVKEVEAGVLSRAQALEILYPDLEWVEDAPQMMQVVEANRGGSSSSSSSTTNGEASDEDKLFNIKLYK